MAKYSMKDRKDMSRGTRDYDKGYAKGKGMGKKIMGHDGSVHKIQTTNAQKYDLSRMKWIPFCRDGYDREAFDYQW